MEKSCNEISSSSETDQYLKQLNKTSHKISKPIRKTPFENHPQNPNNQRQSSSQNPNPNPNATQQEHQPQPPVYNINKNDFRDVVQKLTGSPAHDRFSNPNPNPIHAPKPQSSRLQKIRPPPLSQIRPPIPLPPTLTLDRFSNPNPNPRPPFSPLPPFPTVSATAESPISAYMRCLQNSTAGNLESRRSSGYSPLPEWNAGNSIPIPGSSSPFSQFLLPPLSPMGFGPLSPSLLFSPTSQLGFGLGFPPLPQSPRLQVPSPRWTDL